MDYDILTDYTTIQLSTCMLIELAKGTPIEKAFWKCMDELIELEITRLKLLMDFTKDMEKHVKIEPSKSILEKAHQKLRSILQKIRV